jgi:hypothetical protein
MADKRVGSTQEIVCAFSPPGAQFLRTSTDGYQAEQKRRTEKLPHVRPVHAGGFIIAKCIQNGIDYGLISGTCTSSTSIAKPSRQSS